MAFEHSGEWWDPRDPQTRRFGTLKFDEGEGARLVLADRSRSFGFGSHREHDVILGDTIDGKRVSLLNCLDTRTSFGTGKLGRREMFAHVVLNGIHVKDADPPLHAANATFRNAAAWWGKSGVNVRLRSKTDLRRATIRYSAREPIVLFADGDVTLSAYATLAELPWSADDSGDYRLREEVRIELVSKIGRPLSYVTSTMHACQDLLSIACQAYCDMTSLNVFADARHSRKASYHADPVFRGNEKSRRHKLLFGRADIARDPRRVFTAWLGEADKIASMRAVYFSAVYGDHFIEGRFISLCQAIEGFHSRYRRGLFMDQAKFDARVLEPLFKAIPKRLDPLLAESMRSRIRFGNQYSLNKRLRLLFAEHHEAIETVLPKAAQFIRPIIKQRNLLTHDILAGAADGKPEGEEFLQYNFILKLLAELCFLTVMKIPKKRIKQLFAKSRDHQGYARRLFGAKPESAP